MKSELERFAEKYRVDDSGCWIWTACTHQFGYGEFRFRGKCARAHRVAYELLVGPIPEGLTIDHLCRVRNCVNPAHLEPVTFAENVRRGAAAITHCPHGHEYTEANTLHQRGRRNCRTCRRARKREARQRLRVAA